MAADSDYQKIAEHALAMLKAVYLREGPDAAVRSAKYMVEARCDRDCGRTWPCRNAAISARRRVDARTRSLTAPADDGEPIFDRITASKQAAKTDVCFVPIADIARAFRLLRRDAIRLSPTSRCS